MRFLIVDDSSTMRRIIINTLNKLGHQDVQEAGNGKEGLERLTAGPVVTDWNMPEMSGIEFIRAVRATAAVKDVPVLMVTTNARADRHAKHGAIMKTHASWSDWVESGDWADSSDAAMLVDHAIGTAYPARLLADRLGVAPATNARTSRALPPRSRCVHEPQERGHRGLVANRLAHRYGFGCPADPANLLEDAVCARGTR